MARPNLHGPTLINTYDTTKHKQQDAYTKTKLDFICLKKYEGTPPPPTLTNPKCLDVFASSAWWGSRLYPTVPQHASVELSNLQNITPRSRVVLEKLKVASYQILRLLWNLTVFITTRLDVSLSCSSKSGNRHIEPTQFLNFFTHSKIGASCMFRGVSNKILFVKIRAWSRQSFTCEPLIWRTIFF